MSSHSVPTPSSSARPHGKKCAVIGAPFGYGQPKQGVDTGPEAILRGFGGTKLTDMLQGLGYEVSVENLAFKSMGGDPEPDPSLSPEAQDSIRAKNVSHVGSACRQIHEAVYRELSQGNFVINLGGDHSIAIGTLSGVLRTHPDACVVWVDAHADINTPTNSISGNMHGMPVSFLMDMFDANQYSSFSWFNRYLASPKTSPDSSPQQSPRLPTRSDAPLVNLSAFSAPSPSPSAPSSSAAAKPALPSFMRSFSSSRLRGEPAVTKSTERFYLRPDRIAYIGLRDLDEAEKEIIKRLGIPAYSMSDVERLGIHRVMENIMAQINPSRTLPIHLSFDIDGLDPAYAPSTGTTSPGGLTLREGRYIAEYLSDTGLLTSMDLVEVNPNQTPEGCTTTVRSAIEIILQGAGRKFL